MERWGKRDGVGHRALHTGTVLGWTLLSVVAPGAAHLRAGRRGTGLTLLTLYLAGLLALLTAWLVQGFGLAGAVAADSGLVTALTVGATLLGLCWFALVVHSFVVLRPALLTQNAQLVTGCVAGLLAVAVLLPFGLTARSLWVGNDALNEVFDTPAGGMAPIHRADPWAGRERVNVLLLGGDADDNRIGVRTDSMHVASIDVRSGNTVLLSLPRNLEYVRFKPGTPLAQQFPDGFRLPPDPSGGRSDLLNSVWEYADAHPELFGGRRHMGARALSETIGHTLGLEIDWYVLANMWGFAKLIDAIGGVTLTVETDVVYGRYDEGLVRAGTRRLGGAEAMWYARSRTDSDDFTRMRRQRCVIGALLGQADPATVLSRFTDIARAAKQLIRTDIPRPWLEHLVPLAAKVKNAKVTSVQFVPPLIRTYAPDWERIRAITAKALRKSTATQPIIAMGGRTASPSPEQRPSRTAAPTSAPRPLTEGCAGL